MSLPTPPTVLTTASGLMGTLALTGGIYGLAQPLPWSGSMGIPISSPKSPALPYVSFTAARNVGTGLTMLTLLALGEKKAIGVGMMCGVAVCLADAWVLKVYEEQAEEGKAMGHAFMGVLVAGLGWGMWSVG